MKAPKNFYNAVDQKKLGLDDLFTRTAENEADIAAIEEVIENLPEITPVEANPDEPITGILNSVKIGDTNYRVRDEAKITSIKKLNILLTGSNDGYNIALGKVVIYNSITDEYYTFINGTDTITCDKPYHDSNINDCLYGVPGRECRVYKNQGAPTFTITFGNDLNIERYDTLAIYSTNPVSMSANNVKVAISPDGENFVDTIDKNMTWMNSTAMPNVIGNIHEITDPVIDAIITKIGKIEPTEIPLTAGANNTWTRADGKTNEELLALVAAGNNVVLVSNGASKIILANVYSYTSASNTAEFIGFGADATPTRFTVTTSGIVSDELT